MISFSILDLAPVGEGFTPADALHNSLSLAREAERLGFQRFWLAEHHNMMGIASAATAVAIGYVAGGTETIRIGAGGIMLPNHSPLIIAEQFGTLASLYPGRIDLGLGRAPGTDQATARALRRDPMADADRFPQDVQELQAYFEPAVEGQRIRAVPGAGLRVPLWILGSSLFGAQLAAALGLPYGFASHFAPDELERAFDIYRKNFRPSEQLDRPHAMATVNVIAAETDAEAQRLFTSQQQAFVNLRRGTPGLLPPPVDDFEERTSTIERAGVRHALRYAFVGSRETVARGLRAFIERVKPDELMVTAHMHNHEARLESTRILAGVRDELGSLVASG